MKKLKFLLFFCALTFAVSCGQQKRYVSYKVQEGETMRSIAKKYQFKTKDLLRLNPDVGRRPAPNTTIIIPNPKKNNTVVENTEKPINTTQNTSPIVKTEENKEETTIPTKSLDKELEELKKSYVIHKVKPKETVYGLTRFYNITQQDLFTLNPLVKEEGLKIGQIIKIKPIQTKEDIAANKIFEDNFVTDKTLKIAMLLPFRANKYLETDGKAIFSKSTLANIVTDFYLGAEIAIDSIKKQGVNVAVKIIDTGKKESTIQQIISETNFDDVNAVIGPFYYEEAKKMAQKTNAPIVFPMYSKKQQELTSSKIIKTAPNKKNYINALTSYLFEAYNGENIIVVGDGKATSNNKINTIVAQLKKHDSINIVSILKPQKGYIKKDRFTNILKPKTNAWVIIASDDKVTVADAFNSLISLPEETKVQVFAIEKSKAFNRIDNFKLAQINFSYVTNEYIDEVAYSTIAFNQKYKRKNNALPSNFATRGFDITYDVLARLASSKTGNLKETLTQGTSFRLVSKFNYTKKLLGSTVNNGLFIVKYNDDLSLTRLK